MHAIASASVKKKNKKTSYSHAHRDTHLIPLLSDENTQTHAAGSHTESSRDLYRSFQHGALAARRAERRGFLLHPVDHG